jgi:hypothetical protein
MEAIGKKIEVDLETGDIFCTQGLASEIGPMGSLPGRRSGGDGRAVKARGTTTFNSLQSQLDELRAAAEAADSLLHRGANGQPRGGQALGGADPEFEEAKRAKAAYKSARRIQEIEENTRVDQMYGLATGTLKVADLQKTKSETEQDLADDAWVEEMLTLAQGKQPGTVRAEMRIVKPAFSERVKQVAAKSASSDDPDESWVQEMLSLAGQEG